MVSWEEKAVKYCHNYALNSIDETNLMIIGVILLWIRVINFVRYNDYLGRYLGVVSRLISEISLFIVIYVVNLIFFALLAESSFRELNEYNDFWDGFKTLFNSSFGNFNFDRIATAKISKEYGISYMIIFLIINVGLFMSLFVSVITVLYHLFQKADRVYQMVETLKVRSTTQADKKYSLLISVPIPFNFFLIFAAPVLLTHP